MRCLNSEVQIAGPQDVFDLVGQEMRNLGNEVVKLVCLDAQNRMISCETILNGLVDLALLRPREVFERALKCSANSVVLVHNHPSGSPYPSDSDVYVTKKLVRVGRLIGVRVQDHVIVWNGGYTSMRALGLVR